MRKILPSMLVFAGLTVGCTPVQWAYACGTTSIPPIAREASECPPNRDTTAIVNGARWYRAPDYDVADPDEQPVPGLPLDGDWWDPNDQYERDHPRLTTPPKSPQPNVAPSKAPSSSAKKPSPSTAPKKP